MANVLNLMAGLFGFLGVAALLFGLYTPIMNMILEFDTQTRIFVGGLFIGAILIAGLFVLELFVSDDYGG